MLPLLCLLAGLAATVTGACVAPFTAVGEGCYYFSLEDLLFMNWTEARQYCLSLGSEADLAMLDYVCDDFRNLGSYLQLQGSPTGFYFDTWIGASGTGDSWYWVDGRSFSIDSSYWHTDYPLATSGCAAMVRFANFNGNINAFRVYVKQLLNNSSQPFVCQDFSAAAAVQQ